MGEIDDLKFQTFLRTFVRFFTQICGTCLAKSIGKGKDWYGQQWDKTGRTLYVHNNARGQQRHDYLIELWPRMYI